MSRKDILTEQAATMFNAFDENGLIFGHAEILKSGRWRISFVVKDEGTARTLLALHGAHTFIEANLEASHAEEIRRGRQEG